MNFLRSSRLHQSNGDSPATAPPRDTRSFANSGAASPAWIPLWFGCQPELAIPSRL